MKPLPKELDEKITEIHSWMFEGDQDKIAARTRKSRVFVNRVLNKRAFNAQIIEVALEVMNENRARFELQPKMKLA